MKYGLIYKVNYIEFWALALIEQRLNEPTHEILALFVLCKFILQIRVHSHPVRLDV